MASHAQDLQNLLPYDGEVVYYGPVVKPADALKYFYLLFNNLKWQNDVTVIMGKRIITKRMVAWYGDRPFIYAYSGSEKIALSWTAELSALKELAETITNERYNSCLLNLYHDGSESLGWHSDNERSLVEDAAITSISFGAERKFVFKHRKTKQNVELLLENGSLLLMRGTSQSHWLHSLPKALGVKKPRISLTFRSMID